MKKLLTLLFILILATSAMIACGGNETPDPCESGHDFKDYVSNNDASCTKDGTKTAKCTRCDKTDTIADAGSKKAHDYADATCDAPKTCKSCNATEGEALGHEWGEYTSNEDATCTADGTKTAKCTRCDKTNTIADEGSKIAHSYGEWHVTTPATCTTDGARARECSVCGSPDTEVIDAPGHDFLPATCLAPKTCKNGCGTTEGEPLGHSFGEYVSDNNATCTADGTKTRTCSVCNTPEKVTDEGTKTAHPYGDWVTVTPAKCNAEGERSRTCSVCGNVETEAIEMIDHTYTPEIWGYAGEDGHAKKCTVCLAVDTVSPHTPGPAATEEAAQTCTACGYVIADKLAHTHLFNVEDAKEQAIVSAADCTNNAKYHYSCACGAISTDDNDVFEAEDTALGHSWSDATCTLAKRCSVCGTTEGEPLGHEWGEYISNNDATCTADGTKTRTCSVCNTPEKVTDEGSKKDHDYADATCKDPKTCKDCGATEGEPTDKHTWGNWQDYTETHQKRECSVCHKEETREIDPDKPTGGNENMDHGGWTPVN